MLDFHKYLTLYGELGVQAVIEQIERFEGIKAPSYSTLEQRWRALMETSLSTGQKLAA